MSFADDLTVTDGNPISRYLAVPVPDSATARENVMGAFTTLLDGWRYGADGEDESSLSSWHENNQAFWSLAAIDMEAVEIMKVAIVYDEKTQGTAGGTFTTGAWRQRDLNTKNDPNNLVTVANNAVTIAVAGNYLIRAACPAYAVTAHQARLLKNGSVVAIGSSQYTHPSYGAMSHSTVQYVGTLAVNDTLTIEHRCITTVATFGMGTDGGQTWGVNVYSMMEVVQWT